MPKYRLYIFQIVSIIVLICGYFISDQPDSWSVMHFDLTKTNVIAPVVLGGYGSSPVLKIAEVDHSAKNLDVSKYFSCDILAPRMNGCTFFFQGPQCRYADRLLDNYFYLFYKEINPPPPKAC